MIVHDALGDGEPEAGSLSGWLGREERIEDAAEVLPRNPRPFVFQLELDFATGATRSHNQGSFALHRLERVRSEPEAYLAELALVRRHRRQLGIELGHHAAPREPRLVGQKLGRLHDDAVQVGGGPVAPRFASVTSSTRSTACVPRSLAASTGAAVRRKIFASPAITISSSTELTRRVRNASRSKVWISAALSAGSSRASGARTPGSHARARPPAEFTRTTFRSASSTNTPSGRVSRTTSTNRFWVSSSRVRSATIASSSV